MFLCDFVLFCANKSIVSAPEGHGIQEVCGSIPLASTPTSSTEQEPTDNSGNNNVEQAAGTEGICPEFKQAMDSYEKFFDEYVTFMKAFKEAEDTTSMLGEYASMMHQYTQTMSDLNKIDQEALSDAEALYYADVILRINQKFLQVA